MSHMTEEKKTILIAGRVLGFTPPNQGQLEALIRISKTIGRGTDDDKNEFWQTQVDRLWTVIESMIDEGDRGTLDQLVLTGKTNSTEILAAVIAATGPTDEPAKPVKLAKARVQRR